MDVCAFRMFWKNKGCWHVPCDSDRDSVPSIPLINVIWVVTVCPVGLRTLPYSAVFQYRHRVSVQKIGWSTGCYICPSGPTSGMDVCAFRMFWKKQRACRHVTSKLVCVFCPNLSLPLPVWMLLEKQRACRHVASKLVCVFCPILSLPSPVWML